MVRLLDPYRLFDDLSKKVSIMTTISERSNEGNATTPGGSRKGSAVSQLGMSSMATPSKGQDTPDPQDNRRGSGVDRRRTYVIERPEGGLEGENRSGH